MSIELIQAIDVHGHYGVYQTNQPSQLTQLMSADAQTVVARARQGRIELTIVSPLEALLPRGHADTVRGNSNAAVEIPKYPQLRQYAVIHPRQPESYQQAAELLAVPHCIGIKIHPEEHLYHINEFGAELFEFAARHKAIVLSHSSEQNSQAVDLVYWANRFPEMKLILAHIGCGWDNDYSHQIRGIQQSIHGNVYADTSSSRSITPGLIEWAVREAGIERILFGTDSPLYVASMQRARIDCADLSEADKRRILRDNAVRLFGDRLGLECASQ